MKINIVGDFRTDNAENIYLSRCLSTHLLAADYNIVNFEAPVSTSSIPAVKSGPSLSQPKSAISFLKNCGFNVFLLGNNHTMDYGDNGCSETLKLFSDDIAVGAGTSKEAFSIKIIEADGVRVGLLSLVQKEFGVFEDDTQSGMGVAWVGSRCIERIIREAHKVVEYLLVFPHAGLESVDAPLPGWRDVYKKLIDWGADAIIASHPHSPQGWECYNGKTIFYSLGNFYFSGLGYDSHHWCNSLMITIDISPVTKEMSFGVSNLVFNESGNIGIDESLETALHIEYINELLCDEEKYNNYIDEVCTKTYMGYRYGILRSMCGTSFHVGFYYWLRLFLLMILKKSDESFLLNIMQCETHKWVVERAIRHKLNTNIKKT